jgi:glucose/mannose-6-phosphate isomerase
VRGLWSERLRSPLEVVRGYELPAWVGAETLVVASSYSGATEETISALTTALERGAPVAAISTGGPIHDVAARAGLPLLTFPGGGQPRAAIGYSITLLAGLLERAGSLDLQGDEVEVAARAAEVVVRSIAPEVPTERNPAKRLAWALVDRLPVVVASGFLAPVARRWKTQLNENGKTWAVFDELPEATHNSVVGYPHPEALRDHLQVLFLASPLDHPRNTQRAVLARELLEEVGIGHQTLPFDGPSRFAQALAAIVLGDAVSIYLAAVYGLDPTPVEAIARIKARMAETSA